MSDTPLQNIGLLKLKQVLRHAARDVHRTALRTACFTLAWRWLLVVALLFTLDLLFGLPVWLRWLCLIGQALFLAVGVRNILKSRSRFGSGDEWAARVVEERHPEVDNALINAIQFERALERKAVGPEQAALIQRELVRAERSVESVPVHDAVDHAAEQTALRRIALLLGLWALTGILFSSGFMAILPRLFLPWMDEVTPPYSPTHFDVRPPGATVRYDDSLLVTVGVSGRHPENMSLMTQSQGKEWHRVALDSDSDDTGTYSVKLSDLHDDTWFYVQGSTGRSARYRIVVTRPPVITALRVAYTHPAYTKRAPTAETVGQDGLHGLAGTGVELQITSNHTLRAGTLEIRSKTTSERTPEEKSEERSEERSEEAAQKIPIQVDPANAMQATGRFTLRRSGEYHIALTATDDQTSPDAAHGKIVMERDQRPNIWFTFPAQDLLVTSDMKVPIHIRAEDDVAVEQIQLHRTLNSKGDSSQTYPSTPPAKEVARDLTLDMAALGVKPGDQMTYFATAYDNAPGTPNVGETEVYTIKVVTPEEFAKALKEERQPSDLTQEMRDIASALRTLTRQQEQLAEKLRQLQQQLAKKPGNADLQKQMAQARQEQQALQKQAEQLAQAMQEYSRSPSATDLERALKQKIAQIAQRLNTTAQGAMQQAQSGDPAQSASGAQSAARQMQQMSEQMEGQVEKAVENLATILPLYNDLSRFMALLEQQKQLVQRARAFEQKAAVSKEDRARLNALADAQSRIARDLAQLQKDFVAHAEAAQELFPKAAASARKIAAEIGTRQIVPLLDTARDRFRQWDGPHGLESAQNGLEQMEAMVQECQGGQGQAGMQGELDIALQRLLGQKGLGQSLGQFPPGGMPGMGPGQQTGQGGAATRSAKAFMPSVASLSGSGGDKKLQHANKIAGKAAGLAASEVEVIKNASAAPRKTGDTNPNGYPAEYRKLINDYFKSVAEHQ